MALETMQIERAGCVPGHPWVELSHLGTLTAQAVEGQSLHLTDIQGHSMGCGILHFVERSVVWRRYSHAEDVAFDEAYVSASLVEAVERRSDESCQRLVSSDADYLPGLVVELFGDVLWLSLETAAVRAHADLIAEVLKELVNPVELVIDQGAEPKTYSGQGLKGRWIEVDELLYRIDLLNAQKPRFYLDQREQHPLVGSLCEGRAVLDLFSHSGAFAMQAARAGATRVVSVDLEENYVKAIGANAQRNGLHMEAEVSDALDYLRSSEPGEFDAIVMDPPSTYSKSDEQVGELHRQAFAGLSEGGLLATYSRGRVLSEFESMVAEAAAKVGREARIFARTSQPFDYPMRLNFPESQSLSGLILQVE
ncbi:hypothetical protein DDZ13_12855 [Coraliomargarita sinensis]|uniref:Uncharacterized protein n=1 Tax=Coraliomargarita sinensis TaxID=2174842 RepID=A0A317ZDK6_9BACT|nr:RsmD family RNA methyltransferase [Coraliomargarita sinensis]PXA03306.1 hypothetical protein DDZ13_12855 [Coraliomargarita sinensis]